MGNGRSGYQKYGLSGWLFQQLLSLPERSNFDKFVPFDKEEHYDNFNTWTNYLPRLNHTNSFVRTTLINWVREVATDYDIDGFSLDNVDGIPKDVLEELNNSTEIFIIGQASGSGAALAEYQQALDAVFDNDMYSALRSFVARSYSSNGYYEIPDKLALRRGLFTDPTVLGGYLDNVDTRRLLGVTDYTRLRNALAYLLMAEWIPFLYYGTEQGTEFTGGSGSSNHESLWPYYIEERSLYQFIATILKHRKDLFGSEVSGYQNVAQVDCSYSDRFYSFTRKTTLIIISNQGYTTSSTQYTIRHHPFKKGTELVNIFDSADKVTVKDDGTFSITLENAEPKIYSGGSMVGQSLVLVLVVCVSILYTITKY
ncbi:uncharacterized protein [Ptychodera flava]|uniref:uncharacterized protein n=1 Tax=Ptychodera flava TaxID=63121 RepID=UPI00396A31EF